MKLVALILIIFYSMSSFAQVADNTEEFNALTLEAKRDIVINALISDTLKYSKEDTYHGILVLCNLCLVACKSNQFESSIKDDRIKNERIQNVTNFGTNRALEEQGLQVSQDSVRRLFELYADTLSKLSFRSVPFSSERYRENGKCVWYKAAFIKSLSLLAADGDQIINEFMIDQFQKTYMNILKEKKEREGLRNNEGYFYNQSRMSYWGDFLRLPPSKPKINSLMKILGKEPKCSDYLDGIKRVGDVHSAYAILINYQESDVKDLLDIEANLYLQYDYRNEDYCKFYESLALILKEKIERKIKEGNMKFKSLAQWQNTDLSIIGVN